MGTSILSLHMGVIPYSERKEENTYWWGELKITVLHNDMSYYKWIN